MLYVLVGGVFFCFLTTLAEKVHRDLGSTKEVNTKSYSREVTCPLNRSTEAPEECTGSLKKLRLIHLATLTVILETIYR